MIATNSQAPAWDAYQAAKEQAAYNAFSDLIWIALETGNRAQAQSRYQEAKEVLRDESLADLCDMAKQEFSVTLD